MGSSNGSGGRSPQPFETEDMMIKLFTKAALARMSDTELQLLHRRTFDTLIASDPMTDTRRGSLALLDQIEIELGSRHGPEL